MSCIRLVGMRIAVNTSHAYTTAYCRQARPSHATLGQYQLGATQQHCAWASVRSGSSTQRSMPVCAAAAATPATLQEQRRLSAPAAPINLNATPAHARK
jgi:hypothetical protein